MAQVIGPTNGVGYMVANRIEPVLASLEVSRQLWADLVCHYRCEVVAFLSLA